MEIVICHRIIILRIMKVIFWIVVPTYILDHVGYIPDHRVFIIFRLMAVIRIGPQRSSRSEHRPPI